MNKTPHSFYTIRFTDCDLFGHLNNGRYIDYLLNARKNWAPRRGRSSGYR